METGTIWHSMSHDPDLQDNVPFTRIPAVVRMGDLGNGIGADSRYVLLDPVLRVNAGMEEVRARSA
jgi:hypothetical protein